MQKEFMPDMKSRTEYELIKKNG